MSEGFKSTPTLSSGGWQEFFIDNLLVRIHFIIVMIRWTGLAPWEFPFPGSFTFVVFTVDELQPLNPNPD